MPATPEELEQVRLYGETLKDEHVVEALVQMGMREAGLLDTEIGADPELREITLHNMAVLAGAAARLTVRAAASE